MAERTVTDAQLAVLLRQVQWTLDDAAHDWPAGSLESLAAIVRASIRGGVITDPES